MQRNKEQKDCDLRTVTMNHEGRDRFESFNSETKEMRSLKGCWGTTVAIIIFIAIYSFKTSCNYLFLGISPCTLAYSEAHQ